MMWSTIDAGRRSAGSRRVGSKTLLLVLTTLLAATVSCGPGGGTAIIPGDTGGTVTSDGTGAGASGSTGTDPCTGEGFASSATQAEMFAPLNAYRQSQGRAPLAYSRILEQAAQNHAVDMYRRGFFDHVNPDGRTPLDRAVAARFCRARTVGENIAFNQPSPAEVQRGWQNSPGHNANMLSTDYRYVGMGFYASPNGPCYVQLFGDVFR